MYSSPANIKIQRAGPEIPYDRLELLPAADLERSAAQRRCVTWRVRLAGAWAA
jgi:hypothetical protein